MAQRRRYRCAIWWRHKKWGPQLEKCAAEGTSIRRAINNALLGFFSDSGARDLRKDAHAYIEVKCWRLSRKETADR